MRGREQREWRWEVQVRGGSSNARGGGAVVVLCAALPLPSIVG